MKRSTFLAVLAGLAVTAVAAVVLSGCSDDPSEAEAVEALCSDLNELETALGGYAALNVNSTFEEVEEAEEAVVDATEAVNDSAGDVADARVEELEAAVDELDEAADDISEDDTIGEAATTLASQALAVGVERAALADSVNCP